MIDFVAVGVWVLLAAMACGNLFGNGISYRHGWGRLLAAGCKTTLMPLLVVGLLLCILHSPMTLVDDGSHHVPAIVWVVVLGIMAGWCGDLFLISKSSKMILLGGISFAVGHILYLFSAIAILFLLYGKTALFSWFIGDVQLGAAVEFGENPTAWMIVGALLTTLVGCVIGARVLKKSAQSTSEGLVLWNKLKVGVSAYGILLCVVAGAMVAVAVVATWAGNGVLFAPGMMSWLWCGVIGAVLFVASDIILAANTFGVSTPAKSVGVMATYILAQIMLAGGLIGSLLVGAQALT